MAGVGSEPFQGRKQLKLAAGVSAAAWLALLLGFSRAPSEAYFAYLTAFSFAVSIALGALIFLMVTYVVNARWNVVLRRLMEALASTTLVLMLLFVPLAFGLEELYLWADPPPGLPEHEQHLLEHRAAYLNEAAFLVRGALYFVIWAGCATFLERRARRLGGAVSAAVAADPHASARAFSAALLPLVAVALTFAAFDWLMSLQPFWMSSIFGVYYFAGGFVAALGLLSVLAFAAERGGAGACIRPSHFHALGRLMFGFTVFWAYIAFFQALLIALPNRPEEVVFYRARLEGGWRHVTTLLVATRFLAPFLMLLPRSIKFDGRAMAAVGAWLVLGNYIDMYWLVAPIHFSRGPSPNVWDLAALLAVTAPCAAFGLWRLQGHALVPLADPALPASVAYRSPL